MLHAARTAARHAGELASSRLHRERENRDGEQALNELRTDSLQLAPELEVDWLGVSGYRLTYEGKSLYIDPYVSRVPLRDMLLRRPAIPDTAALDRYLPPPGREAVGVLVGHTHFDHAVDAPAVARRFGCDAYGSSSLARLMALHGLEDRAVEVEPYRVYELGPFEVSFVPSTHSKLLLGLAVPYAGELTCEHLDGLAPGAYRCGQVWGIHIEVAGSTLYHQGSADLLDDAVRHRGVDVFLAGVAGRNFTERYWERILPRLDPRTIVPTHYDNFFTPLGRRMDLISGARIAEIPAEVGAVSRDAAVAVLPRRDGG
ncbi:MAG TPA: MBL fold metallo-hydrolase [Solirubrobacterales bacterium]|jgi:L-ascorbate metabolism protein UlaG (beta-lactamase superfamily)|nr:MBL fold metallo-hydrolase [Solirubrobacterales bacterium]